MARINAFYRDKTSSRPHPTSVECGFQLVRGDGAVLLQLSTYGSDSRVSEKKVSQTVQLDRDRAEELMRIIQWAFPGL